MNEATALLVIDVQRDVVAGAWQRQTVIANIVELVKKARHHDVPVIWVRHSDDELEYGSIGWQIVDELIPLPGEMIIEKHYGDAFEATDLAAALDENQINHLVICGAQSDACVISTLFGSFVRGYDTTLVGDAHTTVDHSDYEAPAPDQIVATVNLIWQYRDAPNRQAKVVTTAELAFS